MDQETAAIGTKNVFWEAIVTHRFPQEATDNTWDQTGKC